MSKKKTKPTKKKSARLPIAEEFAEWQPEDDGRITGTVAELADDLDILDMKAANLLKKFPSEFDLKSYAGEMNIKCDIRTCRNIIVIAGGTPSSSEAEVKKMTKSGKSGLSRADYLPSNGTILKKEWKGQTLRVKVQAGGFKLIEGPKSLMKKDWTSLSALVAAITKPPCGRRNGPHFFGLRPKHVVEAEAAKRIARSKEKAIRDEKKAKEADKEAAKKSNRQKAVTGKKTRKGGKKRGRPSRKGKKTRR